MTTNLTTEQITARELAAINIVKLHMGWASTAGFVPLPGVDLALIVATEVKMLKALAEHYGVEFRHDLVKPLVGALISSGGGYLIGGVASSLLKAVPIVGSIIGMLSTPAMAAASAWATGKVFIQHFESGGTFLNFKPSAVRAFYQEEFTAARNASKEAVKEPTKESIKESSKKGAEAVA